MLLPSKQFRATHSALLIATAALFLGMEAQATRPSRKPAFRIEEASIAQIHAAMLTNKLTCVALIRLRRLDAALAPRSR